MSTPATHNTTCVKIASNTASPFVDCRGSMPDQLEETRFFVDRPNSVPSKPKGVAKDASPFAHHRIGNSVSLLEQLLAHLCRIIHDRDRLSRWLPLTLPYPSLSTGLVVPRSSLLRPGVYLRVSSQLANLPIEHLDGSFLLASSQIYYSGSLQMSRHVHSSPAVLSQPDRQLDRRQTQIKLKENSNKTQIKLQELT
jgi:hypothetical protein